MRRIRLLGWVFAAFLGCALAVKAQQAESSMTGSASVPALSAVTPGAVPRLIKFTGVMHDLTGKVPAGAVGLTFSLYPLPEGGAPLWVETQSVPLDSLGGYTVLLGANSPGGLPLDLFTTGSALWLGVQPQWSGMGEQPRVLLVAVPYALKAADADTLGGKPASAYALAGSQTLVVPATGAISSSAASRAALATNQTDPAAGTFTTVNATTTSIGYELGGASVLAFPDADTNSIAVGPGALAAQSATSLYNVAIGNGALASNTTGADNTAVGFNALYNATATINPNEAFGYEAGYNITTGYDNLAVGAYAMLGSSSAPCATSCQENVAVGRRALNSIQSTAYANTALGYTTLFSNTTGNENTAVGADALHSNTTGNYSTAVGVDALYYATGANNTAVGFDALVSDTTGINNTAIGYWALVSNTTGNYNSALGYYADVTSGNLFNATAIGAYASVSVSNALVLGAPSGAAGDTITANTKVGIDVANPSNIFTVLQGGGPAIADGWNTYSSRRWKTDIQPLRGALSKVELLRGVSYTYTASGKHDIGMIAEEVGKVVPEVVSYEENGLDARGIDYARLTALLVEAVKQQQSEIQQERSQIRRLEAKVRRLEASNSHAVQPVAQPARTAAGKAGK